MDQIKTLWLDHLSEGFPEDCLGEQVEGIELVLLEADIARCISTFLQNGARLDPECAAILRRCHRDASVVVRVMSEPTRAYFLRLERVAAAVLGALSAKQPPSGQAFNPDPRKRRPTNFKR